MIDYKNIDLSPRLCFKCLYYGKPVKKKGKDKWKDHYFVKCSKCPSRVFFS